MKFLFTFLFAKDLGCFGETFRIEEECMLDFIQKKLQNISIHSHQKTIQKRIQKSIERPIFSSHVGDAKHQRTFYFDPSIVVQKELKDHLGNVFYKKGISINPLHIRSLTKPLLFIDGDKKEHCFWAKKHMLHYPLSKIILVKGNPLFLTKQWKRPVYFDQGGYLVKKLGIQNVPAIVRQKDTILEICEERADEK